MANDCSSASRADSEDDLQLLLECLQFQKNCVSSQCQALTTLATMCSGSSTIRDHFRCSGGMKYVLELLYSTSSPQIQQAALYTLGCAAEMNVVNQMKLSDVKLFTFLADLLKTTPQPTPSTAASPALTATTAYLAGCLMSNNNQGQNLAREKRLLHKLTAQFKSHLPTPTSLQESSSQKVKHQQSESGGHYSLEVWTSVCSALCSATNNPQNEINQGICSQLLPAALSVLNHIPLKADALRPAVTLIASCVSDNESTQNRLRLVGGLQILVTALKQLVSLPVEVKTRNFAATELSVYIVRTLSAAMLGNAENIQVVSTLDILPALLHGLQHAKRSEDESVHIVMCLGMLTEERLTAQQQLLSLGGVQVLLSAMAESGNGELNKAITFVLQQCLQQPDPPMEMEVDHTFCAEIAKVEGLLAVEDQPLSPVGCLDTSQQNKLDSSSPNFDHHKQATEALQILDSQKLPVVERVSSWLANNEVCQSKQEDEKSFLEQLQQYMTRAVKMDQQDSGKGENVKAAQNQLESKTKSSSESLAEEHKELCTRSEKVPQCSSTEQTLTKRSCGQPAENASENCVGIQTSKDESKSTSQPHDKDKTVPDVTAKQPAEKSHSKNLAVELARERARRMELEKELEKLEQAKKKKQRKEEDKREKNKPPKPEKNKTDSSKQVGGRDQSQAHTAEVVCASRVKEPPAHLPPQVVDATPMTMRSNIRYAASANVHQSQSLRAMVAQRQGGEGCKYQSKTPGPNHRLSTLSQRKTNEGNMSKLESSENCHTSKQLTTSKKEKCGKETKVQQKPSCVDVQSAMSRNPYPVDAATSSAAGLPCPNPLPPTHSRPLHTQTPSITFQEQPLYYHQVLRSKPMSCEYTCDHQCLGCQPRIKCPLITSRNFIALLRMDRFTCPYHKRLVQRVIGYTEGEPGGSCDRHVTNGESSGDYRYEDEHAPFEQNWKTRDRECTDAVTGSVPIGHDSPQQPINAEASLTGLPSPPLNDQLRTPTTSQSTSSSNTTTSSSPEVQGHSRELDPDWSPTALSHSTDSSCQIVSVKRGESLSGGDRVRCKIESESADEFGMEPGSSLMENVSCVNTENDQEVQYSPVQRNRENKHAGKVHRTLLSGAGGDDSESVDTHGPIPVAVKNTITLSTDDHPAETVYQLTAQPQKKRKAAPIKLSSLPQRNALKNISNHQRCKDQQHSLSVYDYNTPQKTPNKYDQAKPTTVTSCEGKPPLKGQRVLWSKAEEESLISGVNRMGRRWKHILNAYTFHPCRTPVHLKDKYRNIIGRH